MTNLRVLVIGANRGIGLQILKTFLGRGWAASGSIRPQSRDDPSVKDLKKTGAPILEIDYLDEATIVEAAKSYGSAPLDCLVNCACVGVAPEDWKAWDSDMLLERFRVMVIGLFLATKHFLPNLQKSEAGKVLNISSDFASIGDNIRGTCIGYRTAKTALNQQTKTIAQDLKRDGSGIVLVAINPGFIPTKLTKWRGNVDIVQSTKGMVNILENITLEKTGTFWNWDRKELSW